MVFGLSVLNRVYNFARVCPNYKQGIACPKQGNKIELVVLNGVCILGVFFVLNRVRVSNPQRLTYTQIWVEYPPPRNVIYCEVVSCGTVDCVEQGTFSFFVCG